MPELLNGRSANLPQNESIVELPDFSTGQCEVLCQLKPLW
jgi:hypothetical protein